MVVVTVVLLLLQVATRTWSTSSAPAETSCYHKRKQQQLAMAAEYQLNRGQSPSAIIYMVLKKSTTPILFIITLKSPHFCYVGSFELKLVANTKKDLPLK